MTDQFEGVTIVNMNPTPDCHLCGAPTDNKGVPMYEDYILNNDVDDAWEWAGFPACDLCFELQEMLKAPMPQQHFLRLRGVEEAKG